MADDIFRKRVVYQVPGMDAVEVRRDLVYRQADGEELTMDVYLPPGLGEGERRPGVLLVHGGPVPPQFSARVKEMGVFLSYGELLAASGLIAMTFNHGFVSVAGIGASAANVDAAIVYARENAPDFHLDPDRLCFWAFSGGGPFLAPILRERPPYVRSLVSYYAILDTAAFHNMLQTPTPEEIVRDYSPVNSFPAGETFAGPPILVARAGRDWPWLNATIHTFLARALAANATIDFMNHPQGQHGFDTFDDDARSREIIERTIAFVKAHT
ncbi:MAG TPA: alpha/beta hydrolase [Thermoanaerobaculia bacterium]